MISRMQLLEESGPRYGRNLTFPKGRIGESHVHSVTSFKLGAIMKLLEESGPIMEGIWRSQSSHWREPCALYHAF